jgi:hypothetical protein
MKSFLAILLIAGVLLQSMSKLVVEISYAVNKDYIAKNLCENRDKPQMKCCGKCHLAKQLNKTENDNSKNKTTQRFVFDFYVGRFADSLSLFQAQYANQRALEAMRSQQYSFDPLHSVFHPPKC